MQDPAQAQATNPNPQAPVDPAQDLDLLTKDPLPTFADEIKTFDQQHPQSSGSKEHEPVSHAAEAVIPIQEIPSSPEIEPHHEIADYMEKIEKEAELKNPVTDDYTQQVLLSSSANQNPVITLPLTEAQVQLGLHHKVWEAITWLAVWCFRQVKLLPGRVKYKQ